jgi:hypothetical protein
MSTVTDIYHNGSYYNRDGSPANATGTTYNRNILTRRLNMYGATSAYRLDNALLPSGSNLSGCSFGIVATLAGDFDRVRIGILNSSIKPIKGVRCGIGTGGAFPTFGSQPADTGGTAGNTFQNYMGTARQCTFSQGNREGDVPATWGDRSTYAAPGLLWTDWMEYYPATRSDSGTLPLLGVIIFIPPGNILSACTGLTGYSARSDSIGTDAHSGRPIALYLGAGDGTQNVGNSFSNFAGTTATSGYFVPDILIQYRSKNEGATVMTAGDSIWVNNAPRDGNGFVTKAIIANSTLSAPVELVPTHIAGSSSFGMDQRFMGLLREVNPAIYFAHSRSYNDVSATLTSADTDAAAARILRLRGTLDQYPEARYSCKLLLSTWLPNTNATKAYGATDTIRTGWNTTLLAGEGTDYSVVDLSATLSGSAHASGQIEPNASYVQDGLHLSSAGHTALQTPLQTALATLLAAL